MEWRWEWLSAEARPVPEPVATPVVWAGASLGAAVLVIVLNVLGEGFPSMLYLVVFSTLAASVSWRARLAAAPGTALLCWFVLNAFAIPPAGELSWRTSLDGARITCLLVTAVLGTALARLAWARGAYRRMGPPHGGPRA